MEKMSMVQDVLVEAAGITPQERLAARLERAIELRAAGQMSGATTELEETLAEARLTPYEVKFQTRVRLVNMLTGAYLAASRIEQAREMLAEESVYAEQLFSLIAATGSAAEKRMANADRVQIRDLSRQVNLIGQPAPEIAIAKWINSEPHSLEDLRGQVVLLEFWATWCKPCHEMFPTLRELHATHSGRGLRILALTRHYLAYGGDANAREEELNLIRQFVAEHDVAFPVGVSEDERTQTLYGATGLPAVALIDRRGIVRYRFGGGGDAMFHQILQECLDE
jgi:thiol-disulfide isomerase/thioredoxin